MIIKNHEHCILSGACSPIDSGFYLYISTPTMIHVLPLCKHHYEDVMQKYVEKHNISLNEGIISKEELDLFMVMRS